MTLEGGGGGGGEGKVACEVKPPVPVKMSSTAHIPATVIKLFRFYVSTHSHQDENILKPPTTRLNP